MNDEFTSVFMKHKDDVYRLAYSYTLNKVEAEDILQSVFLKLYNNLNIIKTSYLKRMNY